MFVKIYHETGDTYWKERGKNRFVYTSVMLNSDRIIRIYEDATNTGFHSIATIDELDIEEPTMNPRYYYIKHEDALKLLA